MDLNFQEFLRGQGWFILPAAFEEMFGRLHAEQKKGDGFAAIADRFAAARSSFDDQPEFYQINDGVAVIPISGPLMKRASFLTYFFGGTSYPYIRRAVREAVEDDKVDAIVLKIDSPGGVVNGVEETGDVIFNARAEKPIVAYADGMMASAAYWVGSAASKIYTSKTASVGSIGVLMVHEDWSRWNETRGIKVTYLTAGKYKALGNPDEPLTEIARDKFQQELDFLYNIFIGTVARNRDEEEQNVLADMADGRIFIGQQAADVRLVDGVDNFNQVVDLARGMAQIGDNQKRRFFAMGEKKEQTILTVEDMRAQHGELVAKIEEAARSGVDTDKIASAARDGERDRVLGIAVVQFGEEEGERFRAVVETGVTVEQFKAIKGATPAETKTKDGGETTEIKARMLSVIEGAGAENPGVGGGVGVAGPDYMQAVADYQAAHKCSKFEAMAAVNRKNPQLREDYIKKANG